MKCSLCGSIDLKYGIKNVPFTFRGHKTEIQVEGEHCSACGEVIMNKEQANAYQRKIKEFKALVSSETISPDFIMQVRKKLLLTQKEASKIFGGGVNAFSRYENGKAVPHPATIQLLRMLNNHPELLNEIKND